jgi:two-component system chemotaxis sensor kinase CheA
VEEVKKRDLSHARTPPVPRVEAAPPRDPHETPLPPGASLLDEDLAAGHASAHPALHVSDPAAVLPPVAARDISLRSVSHTVRVDIRKLDRLMNALGELSLVRGALLRFAEKLRAEPGTRRLGMDLLGVHRAFERQLAQMQGGILEVRMVPLGQVFDKLARIVRQVSREQNKSVHFVVTGGETEIDKLIVEELSDPLLHMIRNAIDHGIEAIHERGAAGKPDTGTVALNAYQQGNHVVIEVEDDGRGIDAQAVLQKAVAMGLVGAEEAKTLSVEEAVGLVFMQGFSTRDTATALSGRGIGMDIVKTRIAKLGGLVDITSEVQIGTKITLTLPVTLAIVGVLSFVVESVVYCMPLSSMEEAVVFEPLLVRELDGREVMTHRGVTLPIVRLARLFSEPPALVSGGKQFLIVARVGTRRLGMVVDRLIEQQDVVIKALGRSLAHVRGFAGATDLGDQRVALILDVPALIEECLTAPAEGRRGKDANAGLRAEEERG